MFDFDGTIVDSMNEFADIASRVMPKYLPIDANTAKKKYMETSGIPFFQQLEQIFPNHKNNAKTSDEFERTKLETYYDKSPFPEAKSVIKRLRNLGFKTIVSSNNFQDLVDEMVKRIGMEFDMVLGFKDGFAKGHDHFSYAEKQLGVTKEDMIFIGDSLKDGERAKSFGIRFIAKQGIFDSLTFKRHFPDSMVISSLTELEDILTI